MVTVKLTAATICFLQACYPALVGKPNSVTPLGEYQLVQRFTEQAGYDGDVLQFHETEEQVYSIHRVWLLRPEQKRLQRLASKKVNDRLITSGCINVSPDVYEQLIDCCKDATLVIER
jgi:hypothetical protein